METMCTTMQDTASLKSRVCSYEEKRQGLSPTLKRPI